METITIKIQSLSSVITNSSSEIFQINVDMPENTFKDIWIRLLDKYEEGWDEYSLTDTYLGTIESIEDHIEVRFPVMCNIGIEMRESIYLEKKMLIGWNIKIQSVSDVITNSSTEIYVEATEYTLNGIKNIVNSILKSVNSEYTADDLFEFSLEDKDDDYPYQRNYIVIPKKPEYKYAAVALCNLDQLFNMEAVFE